MLHSIKERLCDLSMSSILSSLPDNVRGLAIRSPGAAPQIYRSSISGCWHQSVSPSGWPLRSSMACSVLVVFSLAWSSMSTPLSRTVIPLVLRDWSSRGGVGAVRSLIPLRRVNNKACILNCLAHSHYNFSAVDVDLVVMSLRGCMIVAACLQILVTHVSSKPCLYPASIQCRDV